MAETTDNAENIAGLYDLLRSEVDQFEQARSSGLLDEIDCNFQRFARLVALFLVSERDTYYGYFFMAMTFRTDFACTSIAGIRLDQYPPVFETNPLILMRYSLKEIVYIFCHEVDHVVFNHPAEMVRSNPEGDPEKYRLFNLAADAAVNDQLNQEIADGKKFLRMPKGAVTSQTLKKTFGLRSVKPGESYQYYYDLIKDKGEKPENSPAGSDGNGGAGEGDNGTGVAPIPGTTPRGGATDRQTPGEGRDGASGAGASEATGASSAQDDDARAQAAVTAGQAAGHVTDHEWLASEGTDQMVDVDQMLAEATKELVNEANQIMGSEARGMMPARFSSQVKRLNRPAELNWQSILKKYVGAVAAEKQKTRARLNRRQPRRYDLSGSREGKMLRIVVAIDTSASMGDDAIRKIFNEIFAIVSRKRFELTVIECDASIQRVYELKSPNDLPDHVNGRGGTAFTPVINYINENRRFRDALLIYFTDGFGESRIPKPLTYRNLWVILGDPECLSVKRPYGSVLPLRSRDWD